MTRKSKVWTHLTSIRLIGHVDQPVLGFRTLVNVHVHSNWHVHTHLCWIYVISLERFDVNYDVFFLVWVKTTQFLHGRNIQSLFSTRPLPALLLISEPRIPEHHSVSPLSSSPPYRKLFVPTGWTYSSVLSQSETQLPPAPPPPVPAPLGSPDWIVAP